jgi:hypothetical protein
MNDSLLQGIWKGHYRFYYFDENSDEIIIDETKFNFAVNFEAVNGEFTGLVKEENIEMDKSIVIKGFFEDNLISFEKKYPYFWTYDENGNNILDKTKPHYKIYYTGIFDASRMTMSGEWEMPVEIITEFNGDIVDEYQSGSWELQKVPL